jgi:hypothetical protein
MRHKGRAGQSRAGQGGAGQRRARRGKARIHSSTALAQHAKQAGGARHLEELCRGQQVLPVKKQRLRGLHGSSHCPLMGSHLQGAERGPS